MLFLGKLNVSLLDYLFFRLDASLDLSAFILIYIMYYVLNDFVVVVSFPLRFIVFSRPS